MVWGILWNLGDAQGLTRFREQYKKENWDGQRLPDGIPAIEFDVIIHYCYSDFAQADKLTKKLRGYGIRAVLNTTSETVLTTRNVMIDTVDAIRNIKHFIICLSENCARSNSCRAILQYAHKKQLILIPVIVQPKYSITHSWLDYIIGSLPIFYFDNTQTITDLIRKIKDHDSNVIVEYDNQSSILYDDNVADNNSYDLYNDCKNNEFDKIKRYINNMTVKQINKQQPNGSTPLHVSAFNGHYEIVKLLLVHGAQRSIRNAHNLTAYEEARTKKIGELLLRNNDNYYFITNINDVNALEWTIMYEETKAQQLLFRKQLLGDISSSLDHKSVINKFQKNFLQKLQLEPKPRESLNLYFTTAAEENNLRHVLTAYTSPTIFHKILNQDLATYVSHYFDTSINKTQDYTYSNSIIDLITLLICSDDLDSCYCQNGVTSYRGMLLTRDVLKQYYVGLQIMNVSFLSTSKNREIAQKFAGEGAMDSLRQTPDHILIHLPTICIYHTRNRRTALQIDYISEIPDEEEILILPFSAYEIISIKKCNEKTNDEILIEIELEECEETT
jgi:hypothetical protein